MFELLENPAEYCSNLHFHFNQECLPENKHVGVNIKKEEMPDVLQQGLVIPMTVLPLQNSNNNMPQCPD